MASRSAHRILITRPTGQHIPIFNACAALGLDVVHMPCLIIEPLLMPGVTDILNEVKGPVLITSTNAVLHANQIKSFPWPQSQIHVIGKASARALADLNQPIAAEPLAPYNSESCLIHLLAKPAQSILIVKGAGGRTLIHDTLVGRGWDVQSVDVYQRRQPTIAEARAQQVFANGDFDLISVSSDEVLINLMALSESSQAQLLDTQLIVNSSRCARLAAQFGFSKPPMIAKSAGDEGQLRCIKQWLGRYQEVS